MDVCVCVCVADERKRKKKKKEKEKEKKEAGQGRTTKQFDIRPFGDFPSANGGLLWCVCASSLGAVWKSGPFFFSNRFFWKSPDVNGVAPR